jgi:endonuclease YncB( thermonuclease family)
MSQVKIFWDPRGFELDALGTKEYIKVIDGDTPYVSISISIRMLSIDTPEKKFPGAPPDEAWAELANWLQEERAPVSEGLADYLRPELATGRVSTLQKEQGKRATEKFKELLDEKLTKPNGRKRRVFLRAADQHFDRYGRLLPTWPLLTVPKNGNRCPYGNERRSIC